VPARTRPTTVRFLDHDFERTDENPHALTIETVLRRRDGDTVYETHIRSNGSTWGGEAPHALDSLISRLATESLDRPTFPRFAWQDGAAWRFFGNFATYSHVFNITSDDPVVIEALRAAIRSNQNTKAYKALPAYTPPRRRRR
jgi:hypothetical protein